MSKSIQIVWASGHCGLPGNDLADHQVKVGAAETQPDKALDTATQRALIHHSCRPPLIHHSSRPPLIHHERLKVVYTSLPNEQIKAYFFKTEHTDMARIRSGHHPALHRRQHFVGVSGYAICQLCGEEVESAEHTWKRCPAFLVECHHSDLGHRMDELVHLPCTDLALLMIILRRLWQQQHHHHHHFQVNTTMVAIYTSVCFHCLTQTPQYTG